MTRLVGSASGLARDRPAVGASGDWSALRVPSRRQCLRPRSWRRPNQPRDCVRSCRAGRGRSRMVHWLAEAPLSGRGSGNRSVPRGSDRQATMCTTTTAQPIPRWWAGGEVTLEALQDGAQSSSNRRSWHRRWRLGAPPPPGRLGRLLPDRRPTTTWMRPATALSSGGSTSKRSPSCGVRRPAPLCCLARLSVASHGSADLRRRRTRHPSPPSASRSVYADLDADGTDERSPAVPSTNGKALPRLRAGGGTRWAGDPPPIEQALATTPDTRLPGSFGACRYARRALLRGGCRPGRP